MKAEPIATPRAPLWHTGGWNNRGTEGVRPRKVVQLQCTRPTTVFLIVPSTRLITRILRNEGARRVDLITTPYPQLNIKN